MNAMRPIHPGEVLKEELAEINMSTNAFAQVLHVVARPVCIEFPDAVYHMTSRGNAREPILIDDSGHP